MTKNKIMAALLAVAVTATSATVADAKKRQKHRHYVKHYQTHYVKHRAVHRVRRVKIASYGGTIQAHPAGCPRYLFCGCGVSVDIWGKPVRDLFLATNYGVYFNRTHFGTGAVAYRPGHVLRVRGGTIDNALVYDPNSGGGQTRLHYRNLSRYTFVDPHSPKRRLASLH